MKQILIAAHGKMASGIRYTLELIAGKMTGITTLDAYVNPEEDVEKILEDFFEGHREDRIFVFTDLMGGSVNQKVMRYANRPGVTVITGTNLPILLQVALGGEDLSEEELAECVEAARQELQIVSMEPAGENKTAQEEKVAGQGEAAPPVQDTFENSEARITALRVDDRLIHGQVAMTWTKQLRVEGIIVANDSAANDRTQKMALQMAAPAGIRVLVKPLAEAVRVLNYPKASRMRLLVLTRTVRDALEIRKNVGEIGFLNVGNVGRFDGIDISQKKVLSPTIMLTGEEIECLEELVKLAPDTCMQQVPGDERKLIKDIIMKLK